MKYNKIGFNLFIFCSSLKVKFDSKGGDEFSLSFTSQLFKIIQFSVFDIVKGDPVITYADELKFLALILEKLQSFDNSTLSNLQVEVRRVQSSLKKCLLGLE